MHQSLTRYAMLALSVVGSATLLFSCSSKSASVEYDYESLMTEYSEHRRISMVENGTRSYTFEAPLIEGYSLAKNPYQEFRKGIKMTTYTSDSLSLEDATITANYAIYYDKQKLWEAKGNVVIIKKNRKGEDTTVVSLTEVYTQQLFWDARTKKIYSNVDTKVLQPDGWHFGVGFEADEDLKNIHFRKYKSEMEFDFSPVDEQEDDASADEPMDGKKDKPQPERPKSGSRPNPRSSSSSRTFNPSSMSTSQPDAVPTTRPGAFSGRAADVKSSSTLSADIAPANAGPGGLDRPSNVSMKPVAEPGSAGKGGAPKSGAPKGDAPKPGAKSEPKSSTANKGRAK
ncbi:MAG: LPS export ABC transporter periplasmic protein LptC [Alistipes sp.]|nr:LPS export ABC transporter periplasmic protein LptC [Alistipes sp.]